MGWVSKLAMLLRSSTLSDARGALKEWESLHGEGIDRDGIIATIMEYQPWRLESYVGPTGEETLRVRVLNDHMSHLD